MSPSQRIQKLPAQWVTPDNFKPYGQVIFPSEDGKFYDGNEAVLNLKQGTPRFYIMRLHQRGRRFHTITRHVQCTQCLGSLEGKEWLIAVAPPGDTIRPDIEDISAFRIPGNCFIKLELGTWHAGPYFDAEFIDFYNLELTDTNLIDHFSHDFIFSENLEFELL